MTTTQQHESVTHLIRTRAALLADGWTDAGIQHAIRQGRLRTVFAGTYVTHGDPAREPRLMLAALQAHLGPSAVGVLHSAALVHGLPLPWPGDSRVHVRVPPGHEHAQRASIAFHCWQLRAGETCVVAGLRVTTIQRTLVDLLCTVDRFSAVAALDHALSHDLVTKDDVAALRATTVRRRGAARSRDWWLEGDPRAESPLETRVRLRATDAGYPPDALQVPFAIGGRAYRADLGWRQPNGRWLLGEADGHEVHDRPEAIFRDRARSNDLVGTGSVDLLRFTWRDTTSPDPVPRALARLLGPRRDRRA